MLSNYYVLIFAGGVFGRLMPKPSYFNHALYTFDIGQNDLTGSFLNHNMTIQQVEMYIPELVQQFSLIIKVINILTIKKSLNHIQSHSF